MASKIVIQATAHMAADKEGTHKEAVGISRIHPYHYTCNMSSRDSCLLSS